VQTAHDQVPPEVPVKLPGMPSNRGGWTWLEVPKITKPLGLVNDGAVGCMGSYVHYIWQKPKKKKSKATWRKEEEALSSDEPYKLKETINDIASTPLEGPQEEPTTAQEGMPPGTTADNVPVEQGWGRPHQKNKKKLFFLLLKHQQLMCHVDEPA